MAEKPLKAKRRASAPEDAPTMPPRATLWPMKTPVVMAILSLSICPCGFGVLDDRIEAGTKYIVDLASVRGGFRYRCGGCGKSQDNVTVIDANQVLRPAAAPAPLPYDLFLPGNIQ